MRWAFPLPTLLIPPICNMEQERGFKNTLQKTCRWHHRGFVQFFYSLQKQLESTKKEQKRQKALWPRWSAHVHVRISREWNMRNWTEYDLTARIFSHHQQTHFPHRGTNVKPNSPHSLWSLNQETKMCVALCGEKTHQCDSQTWVQFKKKNEVCKHSWATINEFQ